MPTSVTCPKCQRVNTFEQQTEAQQHVCTQCGAALDLPNPGTAAPKSGAQGSAQPSPRRLSSHSPVFDPSEETNDSPRTRHYERHRRDKLKPAAPADILTVDPARWNPVRRGLTIVLWGWLAVLVASAAFTVFRLGSLFLFKADLATVQHLGWITGAVVLLGALAGLVGEGFCIKVPRPARAHVLAICSSLSLAATIAAIGAAVYLIRTTPEEPIGNQKAETEAPASGEAVGKVDQPVPSEPAPNAEQPAPADPVRRPVPLPGVTIPTAAKLLVLGAYLVSQLLFVAFLKRVALFLNDAFLAESTGAYSTLLVFHTGIVALFPPEATVACFFWVILLAVQFILLSWFLKLVFATRNAMG